MRSRFKFLLVTFTACAAFASPAVGQQGWYIGMDIGPSLVPEAGLFVSDNDWSTKCDLINNPGQIETNGGCTTQPPRAEWGNEVAGGMGTLGGVAIGYRASWFRVEAEYFHRTATYGDPTPVRIGDLVTLEKADQELEEVESRINGLIGHGLFANAYAEMAIASDYAAYAGVGAGITAVSMDYFNRWKRNDDPSRIDTFDDPAMKARIAGTTTIGTGRKSDLVFGYQALAGLDRALSESVSVGIKLRWTMLAEFVDEAEYVQLRSHESSVGRGERIVYRVVTDDLSAFGVTLSLKYGF
ncbi:MAG: hypothetical protein OXI71_16845 [Gemmatimonadota bacterium]|nr:hypothetical protein [Gemmatimonadota bacterium]MDE2676364.1 hypothetical protein [Gemmatimonadota bacterium]